MKRTRARKAPTRRGWAAIFDGEIDLATIREYKDDCERAIGRYIIVHDRFTRVEIRELRRGKK